MRILAIETSCDDTGIAIIETTTPRDTDHQHAATTQRTIAVLSNQLSSQPIHADYGGVFPTLAKREHGKALVPLITSALKEAHLFERASCPLTEADRTSLELLLTREPELLGDMLPFLESTAVPAIDAIAVTHGPGLEPCLWVGINCAKALARIWKKPIVGINHMEGHICAALVQNTIKDRGYETKDSSPHTQESSILHLTSLVVPTLSLLISGGHTEFVLSEHVGRYRVIGQTRDDATGECFDKTARMLGFPYPGGPKISAAAAEARKEDLPREVRLPRPMIDSDDFDFSFSGLKTAVLTQLKKLDAARGTEHAVRSDERLVRIYAREIEDAITDVLVAKTRAAIRATHARTFIVSGGVSANTHIRTALAHLIATEFPDTSLLLSPRTLSTDNALMIALASIEKVERNLFSHEEVLVANGNLRLL